jgi:hypothetical protein
MVKRILCTALYDTDPWVTPTLLAPPLVYVQSILSDVAIDQRSSPNIQGRLVRRFNLSPASKRRFIMLQKSRVFWAQHLH